MVVYFEPLQSHTIRLHFQASSSRFAIVQAHSQIWNVTFSYDPPGQVSRRPSRLITGTNVGLVQTLQNASNAFRQDTQLYLSNPNNQSFQALVQMAEHSADYPVPGGCNLEFPVRISPFLRLSVGPVETTLEFQRASKLSAQPNQRPPSCESFGSSIEYHVFYYFMKEHDYSPAEYFTAIQRMSSANAIALYGTRVPNPIHTPHTRIRFLSYTGKGVVYNVVATATTATGQVVKTAYIPITTYDCNLLQEKTCRQTTSSLHAYSLLMVSLVGLLICYKGSRLFEIQMLLFSFVIFWLLSFIALSLFTHWNFLNEISLSIVVSIGGTTVLFLVWLRWRLPSICFILNATLFALLLANLFLFAGLGNLYTFKVYINFWLLQLLTILLVIACFYFCIPLLYVLSGSFVGSYLFAITFEKLYNGSLIYILVNFIRRAVYDNLADTNDEIPFQKYDFTTCILWTFLCLTGIAYQTYEIQTNKNEPIGRQSIEKSLNSIEIGFSKTPDRKRSEYESMFEFDKQQDIDRYNRLTRSVIESPSIKNQQTPVRSRIRARLTSPETFQSTPKAGVESDQLAISLSFQDNCGSSPSKKLPKPKGERLSLLQSPQSPLNRSNYNAI